MINYIFVRRHYNSFYFLSITTHFSVTSRPILVDIESLSILFRIQSSFLINAFLIDISAISILFDMLLTFNNIRWWRNVQCTRYSVTLTKPKIPRFRYCIYIFNSPGGNALSIRFAGSKYESMKQMLWSDKVFH